MSKAKRSVCVCGCVRIIFFFVLPASICFTCVSMNTRVVRSETKKECEAGVLSFLSVWLCLKPIRYVI